MEKNLLFAKALPEWDFRYFSEEMALDHSLYVRSGAGNYHNLLFAKARPEPDLRYCSNAAAFDSSEKAIKVVSFQGIYLDVWGDCPLLCALILAFKFEVIPIYLCFGWRML